MHPVLGKLFSMMRQAGIEPSIAHFRIEGKRLIISNPDETHDYDGWWKDLPDGKTETGCNRCDQQPTIGGIGAPKTLFYHLVIDHKIECPTMENRSDDANKS